MALPSYGQETIEDNFASKHELSIVIEDIFAKILTSGQSQQDYHSAIYNAPKVGLGYKYHFDNSAIRTKVSFGLGDYTTDNKNYQRKEADSYSTFKLFLGYERHENLNNSQFFYGLDVFLYYGKYLNTNTYYSGYPYSTYENKYNTTGFGVSPLIGAKYFFNPMISVSTELKLSIESYKEESLEDYSINWEGSKTKASGLYAKFGPLGQISINIHF